ncbi:MAG: DUF2785 domain-containing protein [Woeseiaceae bacterium]
MIAAVLTSAPAAGFGQTPSPEAHDKAYWQDIIANDYAPPADLSLPSLVQELSGYLASTDPALRDEIAYPILAQWMYVKRIVPLDVRHELVAKWSANLTRGIGAQGTDSVFLRSFSTLMLSVAVALDNEAPWIEDAEFNRLLHSALTYLREERDTRGFDAEKGWIHSVAHTADLLKFLGRSRHLEVSGQSAILTAIAEKLIQLDHVLIHGEDERLARAVVSILARPDADMSGFQVLLDGLKPVWPDGLPTPAQLAVNENRKNLAVSLYAVLNTDGRDLESLHEGAERVLSLLKTMM